ncbi:MAG: hypothetical protein JNK76_09605, partial [Planctomycetales bacterium]|nr:hypothetical protein [Planctomycetales bacterium]
MSGGAIAKAVVLLWGMASVARAETYTPGQKIEGDFDVVARSFLTRHCVECHGEAEPEGNLSLSALGPIDEGNAAVWKSIWAQVALKEMPPKEADQPNVVERLKFADWVVAELSRVLRDKGG